MWTSIRSSSITQPRHCGQTQCSMAPQPAPRRATRSRTQSVSNTANSMFPELSDGRRATINFQDSSSYNDTAEHLLWQYQTVLECQVDHSDPQVLEEAIVKMRQAGATSAAALQGVGSHGAILQARCSRDSHIVVLTAMLTETSATWVDVREVKQASLPSQAVTVGTCRGQVPVLVVLAGARIIKVLPDRQACAQLLAGQQAQGQGGSTQADAAAVDALVAEAQQAFHDGLEAGDIALPLYDWL